jgi:outer membrane lipopolysaccharide assembly protein LptE/RlpB
VKQSARKSVRALLALAALLAPACGYHVAGRADLVPKSIQTIAIPAFSNITTRYKLTDRLSQAISREFISRTRYHVVSDPDQADAVLRGAVLSYSSSPTIFDPATGRASGVQLQVTLRVSLVERASGKVLFNRPNMDVRERYQISTDPSVFFEESDAALDRASQQTARQLVSAILENF